MCCGFTKIEFTTCRLHFYKTRVALIELNAFICVSTLSCFFVANAVDATAAVVAVFACAPRKVILEHSRNIFMVILLVDDAPGDECRGGACIPLSTHITELMQE